MVNTQDIRETVEEIRARFDGGAGSGNWGHVGVPEQWGGSAPGGGAGFRLTSEKTRIIAKSGRKSNYTSRAIVRKESNKALSSAKNALKKAQSTGNQKAVHSAQKHLDKVNKRRDKVNTTQKSIHNISKFNKNASKDRLKDKTAYERTVTRASGAKREIERTFPKRSERGGNGSKGGHTKQTFSKK